MNREHSDALWQRANDVLVGGVNSPVRAFKGVGGQPFFARSGRGAYLTDEDGNQLIDYVLSWGPLILGHAPARVVEAIQRAAAEGSSFGIPTEREILLAERIRKHYPSMERVRLVCSGTEATMSAIRLARGFTGRDLLIKVEGCYHGHADGLLVKAGSGLTTLGVPTSPGVPEAYASCTLTMPYNDLDAAAAILQAHPGRVAAIIIEPVPGNMGLILPEPGYLEGLRALTQSHGALLIFDEVMTGFRVAMGGVQAAYGVQPDLTTLGKVIGGGLPVGAYGGRAEIMARLAPSGPVYQAGTLAGNPLATAAGLAMLDELETPGLFETIAQRTATLAQGLGDAARAAGFPATAASAGTMFGLFFHPGPVRNYAEALQSDTQRFARFFWGMLDRGVYLAPSQFEAGFVSAAHGDAEIEKTLAVAREVLATLS